MRKVQAQGSYTRKSSGEDIPYQYEYTVLEAQDDVSILEMIKLANRMLKVDGNNTAREKAKSANGDSTAKVLTPEQKEANKVERKGLATLKAKAKAKGMSIEDLMELIG
jgi:hypothetical protein